MSDRGAADYGLLVTAADVVQYLAAKGLLGRLAPAVEAVDVREVTAGNMNRVFIATGPLGSLAVKQAPPWVQVVGPEWPVDPARIESEARVYEVLERHAPESIPSVVSLDRERFVLVMEDLSDLEVLRDVLVAQLQPQVPDARQTPGTGIQNRVPDNALSTPAVEPENSLVGTVVGRFVAELTLATSVLGLGPKRHAELVRTAANPELCAMTEAVVLGEPYRPHEHNHWLPELDAEVRALYTDGELHRAVDEVRKAFRTRNEALIHGDLHSGSIMVGSRGGAQATKIFDPEFGFVGPVGMDLGLFWANMVLASIAARLSGRPELADDRAAAVESSWAEFSSTVEAGWASGSGPGRATIDGLDAAAWLERVRGDAWAFAGVEAIRRIAGFSHAADLTSLPHDLSVKAHAELLRLARGWVLTRGDTP